MSRINSWKSKLQARDRLCFCSDICKNGKVPREPEALFIFVIVQFPRVAFLNCSIHIPK